MVQRLKGLNKTIGVRFSGGRESDIQTHVLMDTVTNFWVDSTDKNYAVES